MNSDLQIPVNHWTEAEYWSEPDERGAKKGMTPLFLTTSYSTLKDDDGREIATIRADTAAIQVCVDINIDGNKHCFQISALDYLPLIFDHIGETELAEKIRKMRKPEDNS